jgi:hypothetical protein
MISSLAPDLVSYLRTTASRTSLRSHIASLVRPASIDISAELSDGYGQRWSWSDLLGRIQRGVDRYRPQGRTHRRGQRQA